MKKKNIISCLIIITGFIAFLLWVISSVFKIGVNLKDISVYLQYFYYVVALLVIYFLLVKPFIVVMFAPSFSLERLNKSLKGKQKKSVVAKNYKNLRKLASRLIKKKLVSEENVTLLKTELNRKEGDLITKYTSLKSLIDNSINKNIKKDIRNIVINASRDTLYLTSLSQNGATIDTENNFFGGCYEKNNCNNFVCACYGYCACLYVILLDSRY